jgi:dual specificity phosphatase 12
MDYEFALCTAEVLRTFARAVQEIVRNRQFGLPSLQTPAELMGHVFLGDASAAMDTETLAAMGIAAILNCASGAVLTNRDYYDSSVAYLEFEAEDHPDYDLLGMHFEETKAFLDACIAQNRSALVHCAAGINRSATLAVAYFMYTAKVDLVSAVKHCFGKRPIILCNESFINQLVMFAFRNNLLGNSL